MPTDTDHPSFQEWVELSQNGKPSKQLIAAYDAKHGETRRGIAMEILKRKGRMMRVRKRQP